MTNPLREALNATRNYDPAKGTVDPTEVAAVNAALDRIEEMLLGVADGNATKDTVAIVQVVELMLPSILASVNGSTARKQLAAYNNGDELNVGTDPETVRKAKLYDEVTDESNEDSLAAQLKKLQETQTGTGPRGLGASTSSGPVEAAMTKLRPFVEAAPDRVDGLVDLITKVSGVSTTEYNERSAFARLIMEGGTDKLLGNWSIVDDPTGTHRKPRVLVDALIKVKTVSAERDNAQTELAARLKDATDSAVTALLDEIGKVLGVKRENKKNDEYRKELLTKTARCAEHSWNFREHYDNLVKIADANSIAYPANESPTALAVRIIKHHRLPGSGIKGI